VKNDLKVGQLVCSKRGRDRGKFYLVIEVIDDSFVYLVDGDKRRMENPKRKNVKHLQAFPLVSEELAAKWEAGQRVGDSEIRRVIASFQRQVAGNQDAQ